VKLTSTFSLNKRNERAPYYSAAWAESKLGPLSTPAILAATDGKLAAQLLPAHV
jgi:hypothetical protein